MYLAVYSFCWQSCCASPAQLAWGTVVNDVDHIFTGNGFTKTVTLNGTAKEVFTLDKYVVV